MFFSNSLYRPPRIDLRPVEFLEYTFVQGLGKVPQPLRADPVVVSSATTYSLENLLAIGSPDLKPVSCDLLAPSDVAVNSFVSEISNVEPSKTE